MIYQKSVHPSRLIALQSFIDSILEQDAYINRRRCSIRSILFASSFVSLSRLKPSGSTPRRGTKKKVVVVGRACASVTRRRGGTTLQNDKDEDVDNNDEHDIGTPRRMGDRAAGASNREPTREQSD